MKFRIEVVCINDAGHEHRNDVLEIERHQLAMETLGLNLCESKAMLEVCRILWLLGRPPRICNSGATAPTAALAIPPRLSGGPR